MKILMITPGRLPSPAVKGGAVETLVDLLLDYNEYSKKNEICVVSVYDSRAEEKGQEYKYTDFKYVSMGKLLSYIIKNHILPYRWMNVIFSLKAVRLLKKQKKDFDCIVIQNEFVNGIVMRKFRNSRYIYHAHNDTTHKICKKEKKFLQSCNKVITISDFLSNQLSNKANLKNVITVYNGIDTDLFCKENHKKEGDGLREKYGIAKDEIVIVYSGRLIQEKGIEELLEAFIMLTDKIEARLMIIGASYFEDSKETSFTRRLKMLCEGRENKIIFTGYVEHKKMPDYYSMADIGCVPSLCAEAFGLSAAEQMAMEIPVITTDCGALSEIVNEKCGYVLARDEKLSNKIAIALEELCDNKKLRENMGKNGRKRVCEQFSRQKFCENWFQTVEEE